MNDPFWINYYQNTNNNFAFAGGHVARSRDESVVFASAASRREGPIKLIMRIKVTPKQRKSA